MGVVRVVKWRYNEAKGLEDAQSELWEVEGMKKGMNTGEGSPK